LSPLVNFEIVSKYRNTKKAPSIDKYALRNELFKVQDLPDSHIYNHPEK
jgi:hypothetical protein